MSHTITLKTSQWLHLLIEQSELIEWLYDGKLRGVPTLRCQIKGYNGYVEIFFQDNREAMMFKLRMQ